MAGPEVRLGDPRIRRTNDEMAEGQQLDVDPPSAEVLYFAYGSNMSRSRLRARIASARNKGVAVLHRHQLRFHKVSLVDGSGKCDAYQTGSEDDQVLGVLFALKRAELKILDRFEGVGHGYQRGPVSVLDASGSPVEAECYFATRINPDLRPMDWYLEHVLHGAREAGLPGAYIDRLKGIEAVHDSNASRRRQELSVYH